MFKWATHLPPVRRSGGSALVGMAATTRQGDMVPVSIPSNLSDCQDQLFDAKLTIAELRRELASVRKALAQYEPSRCDSRVDLTRKVE
jgi:hypothetical protein